MGDEKMRDVGREGEGQCMRGRKRGRVRGERRKRERGKEEEGEGLRWGGERER